LKKRSENGVSRKGAKGAKGDFDKKRWNGRGLCELSVLGGRNFLKVFLESAKEG
jgi:hypothetical protein